MYCGGPKLNDQRRHVLTWIGGAPPPTEPAGGELWDISMTPTGNFMIKSAWPGEGGGEILYCGGPKLNDQRRRVLTWIGGELPPTGPAGGELWDIQPDTPCPGHHFRDCEDAIAKELSLIMPDDLANGITMDGARSLNMTKGDAARLPAGCNLKPVVPAGLYTIKSAWAGGKGEMMYCGGPKLNDQRRHVLTWIGGAPPPTGPAGGELWDIAQTRTGHYTIKSAWPGVG